MKYIVLFLLLLTSALAFNARKFRPYRKQWRAFKRENNKVYKTRRELNLRRTIFMENVDKIKMHNEKYKQKEVTFAAKITQFTDMTQNEYLKYIGADHELIYEPKYPTKLRSLTVQQLCSSPEHSDACLRSTPDSMNWTAAGAVTPVKNQAGCAAGWAFATVAAIEGQHKRTFGNLVSLSEQHLIDCSGEYGNRACDGGFDILSYEYVLDTNAIALGSKYPYQAKNYTCRFTKSMNGSAISTYATISRNDEDDLKTAVANIGPVFVGFDATQNMFQFYQTGIYSDPNCSTTNLVHAAVVVGYGTEDGQDYWLIKNSWGRNWGRHGYIKMARNKGNTCGIATHASVPLIYKC